MDKVNLVELAATLSATQIVAHLNEKGMRARIVNGGVYPVGIEYEDDGLITTSYIPTLQDMHTN